MATERVQSFLGRLFESWGVEAGLVWCAASNFVFFFFQLGLRPAPGCGDKRRHKQDEQNRRVRLSLLLLLCEERVGPGRMQFESGIGEESKELQ